MQTIIRLPTVRQRTGLSRSSIYNLIARRQFPAPIKLGARASGWLAEEVDRWINDRIAATREVAA
jgi:prophage regulatory protein